MIKVRDSCYELQFSDIENEGEWTHHISGAVVDPGVGGTVDGGTAQNCGVLIPPWQVCTVLYCTVL